VASLVSSGGGQPFQSDLPPFPQIAFGLVAAFSCVEAACNAKASSGEVAQLGPGSPPAGGRGHDEAGAREATEQGNETSCGCTRIVEAGVGVSCGDPFGVAGEDVVAGIVRSCKRLGAQFDRSWRHQDDELVKSIEPLHLHSPTRH